MAALVEDAKPAVGQPLQEGLGAVVAWQDDRGPDLDIYAQRVGTVGAKLPLVVKNG